MQDKNLENLETLMYFQVLQDKNLENLEIH